VPAPFGKPISSSVNVDLTWSPRLVQKNVSAQSSRRHKSVTQAGGTTEWNTADKRRHPKRQLSVSCRKSRFLAFGGSELFSVT